MFQAWNDYMKKYINFTFDNMIFFMRIVNIGVDIVKNILGSVVGHQNEIVPKMTELFAARLSYVSKLKWLHWKKNWLKSDVFISVKFFVVAWDRPLTFAYILWRHSVTEPMRSILGDLCYKVIHLQTMLNLYGKLFDVKPQHCLILRIFLHVLSNEHRIIIKKTPAF